MDRNLGEKPSKRFKKIVILLAKLSISLRLKLSETTLFESVDQKRAICLAQLLGTFQKKKNEQAS